MIVGGGDSAFDWALALEPIAKSVTLVHRRDKFRAHASTVEQVQATPSSVVTNAEVTELRRDRGDGGRGRRRGRMPRAVPAQTVVAALGFTADLGPLRSGAWSSTSGTSRSTRTMATNLPRVFAAGDITEYPGKVRLIAIGFGEAATAVNNAAVAIDPAAHLFPGHSSDGT